MDSADKPEIIHVDSDKTVQITRQKSGTVTERPAIEALLNKEGLSFYQWSNGPNFIYSSHHHDYHKVIYVVRGSITFGLPDCGQQVTLNVGDRLDLPAGVRHNADVGKNGVICIEAHRA